jgi:uncharacterized membrane protein YgdD (TMEM256/DUF423 family)
MTRFFGVTGCLFGLLWVMLAAVAAHVVSFDAIAHRRFDIALKMLIAHAFALLIISTQQQQKHLPIRLLAGISITLGSTLFCGALLAAAFGASASVTRVAPTGGVIVMLGWALWGLSLMKKVTR